MGEEGAGGAVGGEWLPVGSKSRPVLVHLLLQAGEFVSPVDEKLDKLWKLKKGVVAARSCLFNDLLCQSKILGLTPSNHIGGVGTLEASLVVKTPSKEMVER